MLSPRHVVSEIRDNFYSLKWWRDRVFVPFVVGPLTRLHPSYPGYDEAVHVMDEDWDTLIVLDACRADFFEDTVDTERFDAYSRVVSLGSHSSGWTRKNFQNKQFENTVYVSANPHTTLLANNTFHELIEVWKEHEVSPNQIGPARLVATAKQASERYPNKRLIVHFMQPHGTGGLVHGSDNVVDSYRATIPVITDIVIGLADQIKGKTVITADHGELFSTGIRAMLGIDQHKARLRFPGLVNVPWAEINGQRREITDGDLSHTEVDVETVKERLQDLGYV
jgi:hypothetical protein